MYVINITVVEKCMKIMVYLIDQEISIRVIHLRYIVPRVMFTNLSTK